MLILAFTAVAILAWLGAAVFVNTRRAQRSGACAGEAPTGGIAEEAGRWLAQREDRT